MSKKRKLQFEDISKRTSEMLSNYIEEEMHTNVLIADGDVSLALGAFCAGMMVNIEAAAMSVPGEVGDAILEGCMLSCKRTQKELNKKKGRVGRAVTPRHTPRPS